MNYGQSFEEPLTLLETSIASTFRKALQDIGFQDNRMLERTRSFHIHSRLEPVALERSLNYESPLDTAIALFYMNCDIPDRAWQHFLTAPLREALTGCGLVKPSHKGWKGTVCLTPHRGFIIASDYTPLPHLGALREDFVMPAAASTFTLDAAVWHRKCARALDIGCGGGYLSLRLAASAEHVTAVDINPRALNLARFNCQMAGIDNVTLRRASMFDPWESEPAGYDIIVSNPPFVISPRNDFMFTDGGKQGDRVSEEIVHTIAGLLADGGFGYSMLNWHHKADADAAERPLQWLGGLDGCCSLLLVMSTSDIQPYAANWLRSIPDLDYSTYEQSMDRWLNYYRELGAEKISSGMVIIRKDSRKPTWQHHRIAKVDGSNQGLGAQLEACFRAEDFLRQPSLVERLGRTAFRLSDDHELTQTTRFESGKWVTTGLHFGTKSGFRGLHNIDANIFRVLPYFDGKHPLDSIITELARETGIDSVQITLGLQRIIPVLLRDGMLEAVERH